MQKAERLTVEENMLLFLVRLVGVGGTHPLPMTIPKTAPKLSKPVSFSTPTHCTKNPTDTIETNCSSVNGRREKGFPFRAFQA